MKFRPRPNTQLVRTTSDSRPPPSTARSPASLLRPYSRARRGRIVLAVRAGAVAGEDVVGGDVDEAAPGSAQALREHARRLRVDAPARRGSRSQLSTWVKAAALTRPAGAAAPRAARARLGLGDVELVDVAAAAPGRRAGRDSSSSAEPSWPGARSRTSASRRAEPSRLRRGSRSGASRPWRSSPPRLGPRARGHGPHAHAPARPLASPAADVGRVAALAQRARLLGAGAAAERADLDREAARRAAPRPRRASAGAAGRASAAPRGLRPARPGAGAAAPRLARAASRAALASSRRRARLGRRGGGDLGAHVGRLPARLGGSRRLAALGSRQPTGSVSPERYARTRPGSSQRKPASAPNRKPTTTSTTRPRSRRRPSLRARRSPFAFITCAPERRCRSAARPRAAAPPSARPSRAW